MISPRSRFQEETQIMSPKALLALAAGLSSLLFLTGCPWSKSPNVFEAGKGISMPRFNGPPRQSEPDFEDNSTSLETDRPDADFE